MNAEEDINKQAYTSTDFYYTFLMSAVLTIVGSIIMIYRIFSKKKKGLLYSIMLVIAYSEIINGGARIMRIPYMNEHDNYFLFDKKIQNKIQCFLLYFSDTVTLIFFGILCQVLYFIVKKNDRSLLSHEYKIIGLGIIISFVITVIVLGVHWGVTLKDDKIIEDIFFNWCWIKVAIKDDINNKPIKNNPGLIMTMVIYWLIIIYFYSIMIDLTIFIKKRINKGDIKNQKLLHKYFITFLYYPFVGSMDWIFTTLSLIFRYDVTRKSEHMFEFSLIIISSILSSIRGFFIFLEYIKDDVDNNISVLTQICNGILKFLSKIYTVSSINRTKSNQNISIYITSD